MAYVSKINGYTIRDKEAHTELTNIKDGTTSVGKAINADVAAKATKDSNGNIIADTYATKDELANAGKLDDVKINNSSIANNKVANIATDGDYNASNNKIATESTVNNAVKAAITELVEGTGAEGVVDTFIDLQEYIEEHGGDAADMARDINQNTKDIDALEDTVDSLSIEEIYDAATQSLELELGNGGSGNTGGGSSGGSSGGNCECSSTELTTEQLMSEEYEVNTEYESYIADTVPLQPRGIYLFMLVKTSYDYLTTTDLGNNDLRRTTMYKGLYIHMGDRDDYDATTRRCEYVDMGLFDTQTGDHLYAHVTNGNVNDTDGVASDERIVADVKGFYLASGMKFNTEDGITPIKFVFRDDPSNKYIFSIHRVGTLGDDYYLNRMW